MFARNFGGAFQYIREPDRPSVTCKYPPGRPPDAWRFKPVGSPSTVQPSSPSAGLSQLLTARTAEYPGIAIAMAKTTVETSVISEFLPLSFQVNHAWVHPPAL